MKKFLLLALVLVGAWIFSGTESGKNTLDGRLFQARLFFENFIDAEDTAQRAEMLGLEYQETQSAYENLLQNFDVVSEKIKTLDLSPEELERQLGEKKTELEIQKRNLEAKLEDLKARYEQARTATEQMQGAVENCKMVPSRGGILSKSFERQWSRGIASCCLR
jgi:peptidoglycan hydrolase CwlO-like protein